METADECICCWEVPQAFTYIEKNAEEDHGATCITALQSFKAHLHPSVLQTFFKTNKKNWKKNNVPAGPGKRLSNK